MAKKKNKSLSTGKLTTRSTQAPMVLTRTAGEAVAAPTSTTVAETVDAPLVIDRAQIAELAFAKFVARGYQPGFHVADWLAAEAELRAARA